MKPPAWMFVLSRINALDMPGRAKQNKSNKKNKLQTNRISKALRRNNGELNISVIKIIAQNFLIILLLMFHANGTLFIDSSSVLVSDVCSGNIYRSRENHYCSYIYIC